MLNYSEFLYNEIQKDAELNSFFQKINEYSENIYETKIKKLEEELNSIKADYSQLILMVEKLKEVGIVVTDNDSWFKAEQYNYSAFPVHYEMEDLFCTAKYNNLDITSADFAYVLEMSKSQSNKERFICRDEILYKDWIRKHKSIEEVKKTLKKLEKKEKRIQKKWNDPRTVLNKITETRNILKYGISLKEKLDFLHGLSFEQLTLMKETYGAFFNIYYDFFKKRRDVVNELEKHKDTKSSNREELYSQALLKMIEEKGDGINIKSIERKLAKVMIISKLKTQSDNNINLFENNSQDKYIERLYDFNIDAVDWFFDLKHEEIMNFRSLFIENFDLILEKEKVLKK